MTLKILLQPCKIFPSDAFSIHVSTDASYFLPTFLRSLPTYIWTHYTKQTLHLSPTVSFTFSLIVHGSYPFFNILCSRNMLNNHIDILQFSSLHIPSFPTLTSSPHLSYKLFTHFIEGFSTHTFIVTSKLIFFFFSSFFFSYFSGTSFT